MATSCLCSGAGGRQAPAAPESLETAGTATAGHTEAPAPQSREKIVPVQHPVRNLLTHGMVDLVAPLGTLGTGHRQNGMQIAPPAPAQFRSTLFKSRRRTA